MNSAHGSSRRLPGAWALALLLSACTAPLVVPPGPEGNATTAANLPRKAAVQDKLLPGQAAGQVLGRNERVLIYLAQHGDTMRDIATRFLGKAELDWMIAEANGGEAVEAGVPLIVPLQALNPTGVSSDRVQTVPILCYHRFGTTNSKMVISPTRFASQLDWLAKNGYRVVRLDELPDFLAGRRALPQKSVVITIDDGYESVHRFAYPLLKQYGFPATVFVYTDFIGAGDALRWPQMQEMVASGLIDIQSHSKSHRNLIERTPGETDERYRSNLTAEMQVPKDILQRRLEGHPVKAIAYPYGDANSVVVDSASRSGFVLGATVVPGGNAFYSQPMLLRRTMVFGDLDLEGFKQKLQVSRPLPSP